MLSINLVKSKYKVIKENVPYKVIPKIDFFSYNNRLEIVLRQLSQ